jgi:AraC-like DNA-binding protein
VPTPADHFTAFVERLAADLDAMPSSAEEMARDAGLSRSQFERVVRAVAGESPARFRGRILLERAAYLMVATDRTLLDIALDSGFASHEAFTRAFRRELGVLPSVWRADPTSFRIDSPNDVHFHPPAGLRLPARHRMDSVDLVIEMVEHHVWLVGELVDRARLVSDDDLDAVSERSVEGIDGGTLRWALSRLVGQMEMWNAAVHDGDYDFAVEEGESVTSMRRRLDRVGPEFVDNVSRLAATGRFDETFVEAFSPTPQVLSYGAMVAHVLTFAAHHRLLALSRLRECGVGDLGFGDPKHWFATGRREDAALDQARDG